MTKPHSAAVSRILTRAMMEAEAAGASEVGVNHLLVGVFQESTAAQFLETDRPWSVDELREGKRKES